MKVLVTTGTADEYNFARLFRIIDELCDEAVLSKENIVVQGDSAGYQSRNFEIIKAIPNDEFMQIMWNADVVISHAGTGTVVNALKMKKKIILFPRLAEYGEHIDNHQVELSKLFSSLNYVMCAYNKEELKTALEEITQKEFAVFESNSQKFTDGLIQIIKQYEKE